MGVRGAALFHPSCKRYTPAAIFRPPSSDPAVTYEPYVYPKTADLIKDNTLPNVKAVLTELINLGKYQYVS